MMKFKHDVFTFHKGTFSAYICEVFKYGLVTEFEVEGLTGKVVKYKLGKTDRDREGEITGWVYYPVSESIKNVPECKGTRVLIIND